VASGFSRRVCVPASDVGGIEHFAPAREKNFLKKYVALRRAADILSANPKRLFR
jgi:hypothetical protein